MGVTEGLLQLAGLFLLMAAAGIILYLKGKKEGQRVLPEDTVAQIFLDNEEQE